MIDGERFFEGTLTEELTSEELESIKTRADLRRRQFEFKQNAKALAEADEGVLPSLKARQEAELASVYKEAGGEAERLEFTEKIKNEIAAALGGAKAAELFVPNLAALNYARAAKLQFAAGLDYRDALAEARKYIDKSRNLSKANPSALLPEAIVLGIEAKLAQNAIEVDPIKVARVVSEDISLAKDYALILPEESREEFLRALPEESCAKISALMDKELSGLLPESLIVGTEDIVQRQKVQERAQKALEKLIENPEDKTERTMARTLSETLMELEGEDSKRILQELGEQSLRREKEPVKARAKISYAARVIKTLSEIDAAKGGSLTMKFLGKKEVPAKFFIYFCQKLIESDFITKNAAHFLGVKEDLPFLRKLIAEYPNQFNTVLDTLRQVKGYKPSEHEDEVFEAIRDLESLTPIIFDRYRRADSAGKKELAIKIRELKPKFFRNLPIKNILPREDRDILTEMVYLTYKPIGMSFERVKALIGELRDQTDDLKDYKFPENGFDFMLESKNIVRLKAGEKLDLAALDTWKNVLTSPLSEKEEKSAELASLLGRVAKAGTDFKPDELGKLLGPMNQDDLVKRFVQRYERLLPENAYSYLSELKEIFGIYFKDHYKERLANFLDAQPKIFEQLAKILSNPQRKKTLKAKLGEAGGKIDWELLGGTKEDIANALAVFMGEKVLKSIKESIARHFNKFETRQIENNLEGEGAVSKSTPLKAYISKNIGSFFAKASAGICTAGDVSLFNRDDHFHINIVEDEARVRGNIQAYVIKEGGGKSLVLRGFNPNTDFLEKIDPAAFAEKVIEIGRRFARDNGFRHVYITEQGGWHALSNREKVGGYLIKRYHKEKKAKSFNLPVSSTYSVQNIYEV